MKNTCSHCGFHAELEEGHCSYCGQPGPEPLRCSVCGISGYCRRLDQDGCLLCSDCDIKKYGA